MRVVKGYHGTTLSVARAILDHSSPFRPSEGLSHWLGRGIYFWEENELRGRQWALGKVIEAAIEGRREQPAVIVADIDLSHCLDLCQPEWHGLMRELAPAIIDLPRQHGPVFQSTLGPRVVIKDYDMDPATEGQNAADSRLIDVVFGEVVRRQPITTKRGCFQAGRQLHSNSYLFDEGHVQIAVLDTDALILGALRLIEVPDMPDDVISAVLGAMSQPSAGA